MAKLKPQHQSKKSKSKSGKKSGATGSMKKAKVTPEALITQAIALLQTSQPEEALINAQRALSLLQPTSEPTPASLPVLNLLGEIYIEMGDADAAREYFTLAATIDPEGEIPEQQGGGSEKFLWLAQLCEEGGKESVGWFEKGAKVLKREVGELDSRKGAADIQALLEEKKAKLASVLCGVVEVYMTDLSWEENAEAQCEALITEALLVSPDSPEPLQTLASVRISQRKLEDAKSALMRSMELWKDLEPEDPKVPDFPTRISLSRLLMESGMEDAALEVLERLVLEDDSSVEAWYLGGWCLHLMSEKKKDSIGSNDEAQNAGPVTSLMRSSRDWLQNSLRLYQVLEYEDERLRDHANELVEGVNKVLGPPKEGDMESEGEDEWEDDDDLDERGDAAKEDEDMQGT